jgi:hypothetical protein
MPPTFNRGSKNKEAAPGRAATDKGLENADEYDLCRPSDRLGESFCCRLGADWRRNLDY